MNQKTVNDATKNIEYASGFNIILNNSNDDAIYVAIKKDAEKASDGLIELIKKQFRETEEKFNQSK